MVTFLIYNLANEVRKTIRHNKSSGAIKQRCNDKLNKPAYKCETVLSNNS